MSANKTFSNRPNYQIESVDGSKHWISRSVAAVAILLFTIEETGEIFIPLGQRSQNLNLCPGDWGLVAGFLDWNESAKECVLREVWEELGIDLSLYANVPNQPDYVNSIPDKSENETISLRFIVNCYVNKLPEMNPRCDEVTETFWHNISEPLPANTKLAFNHGELIEWALSRTSARLQRQAVQVSMMGNWPSIPL
jgi:8-oxo-dGTP pyrophosphatase MutT (NUDIX family)